MHRLQMPAPLPDGSRVLHIGLPKTGTSALQASCHAARDELARQGVSYVSRGPNPLSAARFAARGGDPAGAAARRWRRLSEDFRSSTARCTLLSSEGLSGGTPDRIDFIAEELGTDATVVVTLRPVADLLPSSWQQGVRRGGAEPFETWLRKALDPDHPYAAERRRYAPETILAEWGARYGEDRLIFVCSDPSDRMLNHRVFESLLGVPGALAVQPVRNASPPYAEIEMLRHLNIAEADAHVGPEEELWVRARRKIGRRMGDAPPAGAGQQRLRVPRWAAERANEQTLHSIAMLEASGATVVGDLTHLLVDPEDYAAAVTAPDEVTIASAGWFAATLAKLAVDEFDERDRRRINRLERRIARLEERRQAGADLDAASARDLARALARRVRSKVSRRGR